MSNINIIENLPEHLLSPYGNEIFPVVSIKKGFIGNKPSYVLHTLLSSGDSINVHVLRTNAPEEAYEAIRKALKESAPQPVSFTKLQLRICPAVDTNGRPLCRVTAIAYSFAV